MEVQKGQELFCVTTEQIKSAYRHLPVNYPQPGTMYMVRKVCRFKVDPEPFVLLKEIKNVSFAAGHEICFPIRWFADPNKVDISGIQEYLSLFRKTSY